MSPHFHLQSSLGPRRGTVARAPFTAERLLGAVLWMLIALAFVSWVSAAPLPDAPSSDEPPAVKVVPADPQGQIVFVPSVFDDGPTAGKDPFFPKSERPHGRLQPTNALPVSVLPDLVLKGISIAPNRRLALINHYTLAENEEADVRVDNQIYKVRCVQIRDTSVVIHYKGQKKELFLRPGLGLGP